MIDKPSQGLDKAFFVLGNVLLLRCKHRERCWRKFMNKLNKVITNKIERL